ncbi:NINE protein [Periweissella fabalis]|uniref:NINE protein n=1 Tax=Periweissella fabalis TaxID=1070421 RepID=A0A7X6S2I4_9LACO|nr:NINE protein [Periweissella fabalis]
MSVVDDLKKYKELLDSGVLTQEEFDVKKAELLKQSDNNVLNNYVQDVTANPNPTGVRSNKSKIVAGILGIFLGSLGIHNFYLGKTARGLTQLILTIFGWLTAIFIIGYLIIVIVDIWVFIEGILILISNRGSKWHLDGFGNELND